MQNSKNKEQTNATAKPVVLFIAKQVEDPIASGEYSSVTDTWTNRNYELAASKKHNEDM
jgi:hypothetical protein